MTDEQFTATIKATNPNGEVTYTTKGGETEEKARKKAVRWGVAYYLYDNKHIIGPDAALISAETADRMNRDGHAEEDGFTFEFVASEPVAA